jgi:hypothetical protein
MTLFHSRNTVRTGRLTSQMYRFQKRAQAPLRAKLTPQKWKLHHLLFHTKGPSTLRVTKSQSRNMSRMTTRPITVYDEPFLVQIPANKTLYEGLARWYPNLYQLAVQEDFENEYDNTPSYEDYDELWDRMDYLEWMADLIVGVPSSV